MGGHSDTNPTPMKHTAKGFKMKRASRPNNTARSPEDMLMALDQLDQTLEVMSLVINRLRHELKDTPVNTPTPVIISDGALH